MHIEHEVKLDFKDVLIRPKRSTLTSRSDVDITRDFTFRHAGVKYHGIPIIASNMDTTGTFEMARALGEFRLSTALHKHYSVEDCVKFFQSLERKSAAFYSMGITKADEEKFKRVMDSAGPALEYVCIDVANGYHENFVTFVTRIRTQLSAARDHGRKRGHRRDDGGIDPFRRRHRQGRHRTRIGLYDAQDDRGRLPAAFGRDRMRGCRTRSVGLDLR